MAEITAITAQKKDSKRCNIYLDGVFYCGMDLEVVVKNRLKVGSVVTGSQLSSLQCESEKRTALDKALSHISVSMKTEKEIRDYLKKKGYLEEIVSYVVDKMKEYGYIDDAQYADLYAKSKSIKKGKHLIALELRRKGVEEGTAKAVADSIENEAETAKNTIKKYMRNKEVTKENLQKAYRYLLGKGFSYDSAKEAVASLGGEDEDY